MSRRVLLVEGPSDAAAVVALAGALDVDVPTSGVVVMDGITNVRRHLVELAVDVQPAVLHDAGEAAHVLRVLDTLRSSDGRTRPVRTIECDVDLEDELIRALGVERVVEIVTSGGDLAAWHTITRQPFHRDRDPATVMHRFLGAGSGRKIRYAGLMAAALDAATAPSPLLAALDHVRA